MRARGRSSWVTTPAFGAASNAGVAAAGAPVTVLLNPDVVLLDDSLATLAAARLGRRRAARAAPAECRTAASSAAPTRSPEPPGRCCPPSSTPRCCPGGPRLAPIPGVRTGAAPGRVGDRRVRGGSDRAAARARAVRRRPFLFYEDMDLCLRARARGHPTELHPGVRVVHTGGHSTGPRYRRRAIRAARPAAPGGRVASASAGARWRWTTRPRWPRSRPARPPARRCGRDSSRERAQLAAVRPREPKLDTAVPRHRLASLPSSDHFSLPDPRASSSPVRPTAPTRCGWFAGTASASRWCTTSWSACAAPSACSWRCARSGRTPTSSRPIYNEARHRGPASRTGGSTRPSSRRLHPPGADFRALLPFYPAAIESFDLSGYDVVVSSSSAWAHGVICDPGAVHVCYCHNPFRFAWNERHSTLADRRDPITRAVAPGAVPALARWDWMAAQRVDRYLTNSRDHAVADRAPTSAATRAWCTRRFASSGSRRPSRATTTWCVRAGLPQADRRGGARLRGAGRPLVVVGDGPALRALRRHAAPERAFAGRARTTRGGAS